jgi:hypothetical protein
LPLQNGADIRWFFWFHAFSAAVCLAAIPIEAPTCGFATPAFSGLSIVCDLSAAARDGCRVKDGLSTLLGLRKRARDKLDSARRLVPDQLRGEGKDVKDDELHRLLLAERSRPRESRERERGREGEDEGYDEDRERDRERTAARRDSFLHHAVPNPLAPVRPSSSLALMAHPMLGVEMAGVSGTGTGTQVPPQGQGQIPHFACVGEPSVAAGPTIPLWPDAASVLIDYAGLEGNAAFEMSIQPFLSQLEGYAWGT